MLIIKAVVTAVCSVIAMFFISKLLGNKQISELNLFDYINGITIGSIASELAVSDQLDEFIIALIAMVVYGLTGFALSVASMKSIKCRRVFSGIPIMLVENGKLYPQNLRTAKLDIEDLLTRARNAGYFNLADIHYAILENNGKISFMPTKETAPLTPKDLGTKLNNDSICANIILDGVIMEGNLKHMGLETKWLMKQLKQNGYSSPHEIFLCTVDSNNQIAIFPQIDEKNSKNVFD